MSQKYTPVSETVVQTVEIMDKYEQHLCKEHYYETLKEKSGTFA